MTRPAPLDALPKVELHIHIEGALRPELVFRLAARNRLTLPWPSIDALQAEHEFTDLGSFLQLYYRCMDVLRTAEDFRDLVRDYVEISAPQGLRHAELFFDPQAHTARGVDVDTVLDGLLAGLAEARATHGVTGGLILCFLRDRPVDEAMATLESVAPRAADLLGVGLDSAEVGYPPALFTEVFRRAAELGLHRVAHAGEEGPADYIRSALDDLGIERIDHGVRILDDPDLVARVAGEQVPLTVCPLSNDRLRVVETLADHPLRELLAAGLLVTVNSDDPAYFGGFIGTAYARTAHSLDLDDATLRTLAGNAVRASFADDARRADLAAEVAAWPGRGGEQDQALPRSAR